MPVPTPVGRIIIIVIIIIVEDCISQHGRYYSTGSGMKFMSFYEKINEPQIYANLREALFIADEN